MYIADHRADEEYEGEDEDEDEDEAWFRRMEASTPGHALNPNKVPASTVIILSGGKEVNPSVEISVASDNCMPVISDNCSSALSNASLPIIEYELRAVIATVYFNISMEF